MILDLGAGLDPDPRADLHIDKRRYPMIDVVTDLNEPRWPIPTDDADGVIASHVIEHLDDPLHAFQEMARITESDGWIEVTTPLPVNHKRDPTHQHQFTWRSFEFFDRNHPRQYHDLALELQDRSIDARFIPPLHHLSWIARQLRPSFVSQLPFAAGEITARYRVIE